MDKENERIIYRTKIPLPMEPLPPLSENLLQKGYKEERHPLQTLYNEPGNKRNIAGPSRRTENNKRDIGKTKCASNLIDTRHVTVRQNNEELDWDYKVFTENIKIRSTDVTEDQTNNCDEITKKNTTPVLKSPLVENCRVRNIKKSLKRPHSRELQGISPIATSEKGEEKHKRRLYFTQVLQLGSQLPDFWEKTYTTSLNQDYSADLFNYLLNKEVISKMPRIPTDTRACVLNWLLKLNRPEGNPAIVQTARWYLDSLLAVGEVALEKMQVVAAACYWISLKIHGRAATAKKLVTASCDAFTVHTLLAAERAVLRKLKFPVQPITPQEFITYLSWHCDETRSNEIELIATILCMAGLVVNKALCREYPSVIGAAAIRNAVLLLKKDLRAKLETNSVYKEATKKTSYISYISALQRYAIRKMASPTYGYKALLEHYGNSPYFISQKIISFANHYASTDEKTWLVYYKTSSKK